MCILAILISVHSLTIFADELKNNSDDTNEKNVFTEASTSIIVSSEKPEFTLKLKSNPTTGYSWFLREYDSQIITPIKHNYEASTSQLIGASGFEYWTFRVNPTGFIVPQQTTMRMVYARPWQSNDPSTQLVFRVVTKKIK